MLSEIFCQQIQQFKKLKGWQGGGTGERETEDKSCTDGCSEDGNNSSSHEITYVTGVAIGGNFFSTFLLIHFNHQV